MRKKTLGNSLTDYALPIFLISMLSIGGLSLLGKGIRDNLASILDYNEMPSTVQKLLGSPGGSMDGSTTTAWTPVSGNAIADTKVKADAPSTPTFTTDSGKPIVIDQELAKSPIKDKVVALGANGTTRLLASQIGSLARQLLADQEITPSQANALIALANQGHKLAKIEGKFQNLVATSSSAKALRQKFQKYPDLTFAGKQGRRFLALGFLTSTGQALNMNKLNTINPLNVKNAPPATKEFLAAYHQAVASGSLDDPKVKTVIDYLASNISYISHSTGTSVAQVVNNQIPAGRLNAALASKLTHLNSRGICTTGGASDTGVQCSGT